MALQAVRQLFVILNVAVDDQGSVLRNQLGKSAEGAADIVQILEKVQMVSVDIKDDADLRVQREKAVGVFAGLCDEVIRVPYAYISVNGFQNSSHRNRGIVLCAEENFGNHGGCCCFAMRTRYCYGAAIIAHDFSEELGSCEMRNIELPGLLEFRIVRVNGCGKYNKIKVRRDVLCLLADQNLNAVGGKLFCDRRGSAV